ncbi:hypothetical protein [Nocardia gipuzkoensis]
MTETSESQSRVDRLASLLPTVTANDNADPALVVIGERYWALEGFAEPYGTPIWCEKVKDIDTAGWGRQVNAVAAAGVQAIVPGLTCFKCSGPLSLTSRTAFQQVCDGDIPACVECTASLLAAVQAVIDPDRRAKRNIATAHAKAQQSHQRARAEWQLRQQEIINTRYAASANPDTVLPESVRDQVAVLALLRYAPSTTPIEEVHGWADPWHPDHNKITDLLGDLVRANLLCIDPTSPYNAFVWEPASFEDALREAENDLDAIVAPQYTGRFYPVRARYHLPLVANSRKTSEELDLYLTTALNPAEMTALRQNDLLDTAHELIADEAIRYFIERLDELNLPTVPDNHAARLRDAVDKLAERRSLGEIYNLVWRSTRAAAEAAQKNPQAPRANMSTHAVNQLESHAQRTVSDPSWEIKPFNEISNLGLAAMTRTVFYNILHSEPIKTSLPHIQATLPPPVNEVAADAHQNFVEDHDLSSAIAWLYANPDSWNPEKVLPALEALQSVEPPSPVWQFEGTLLAREAARLKRLHERLAPTVGAKNATLATLAATTMLIHPVTNHFDEALTVGEVLFAELCRVLFNPLNDSAGHDPQV